MPAPTTDHLRAALWLTMRSGIGPKTRAGLLGAFGSPAGVYAATKADLLSVPGVGDKLARELLSNRRFDDADAELERCTRENVTLAVLGHDGYPERLAEVPDPPLVLYARGDLLARDALAVAIVGSRHCTDYGRKFATRIASGLASAGVTVVSGLARGIDAAAHRGAIDAGGRTLAVTATGMHTVYPPEHVQLAEEVTTSGAVLCELPFGTEPLRGLFPQRNRIISGLSLGVCIVEAQKKSGSLHTARHAAEQGRDVFALPGRVDNPASEGSHDLIRDGAILIRSAADVLEALGPLTAPVTTPEPRQSGRHDAPDVVVQTPRELTLSEQERTILNAVGLEPKPIDEVIRVVPIEDSRVLATLTILEMKSFLKRLPGGLLVRIP